MKKKAIVWFIVVGVLLSPFLLIAVSQLPWIYYYHYNRVRERLEAIPGIQITDARRHEDVTLEDCWYRFRYGQSEEVELFLGESSDWDSPFDNEFDGIIFYRPYGSSTDGYERRIVSRARLAEWGITFHRLQDLVPQLEVLIPRLRDAGIVTDPEPRRCLALMWDLNWTRPSTASIERP